MAAGDSNIVEVYNAGKQPKQMSMTEDWNKMNSEYKLALSTARSIRNEELSKARDTEKNAKKQYNDALRSGDQEAINKAKGDLDNAKTAKKQVYVAYDEAKNKAKDQRKLTHDALRSAEKEHNNVSADATLNFNKDLADIQKEQTEELSKQFSSDNSKSGSDNQGSDNSQSGTDNSKSGKDNQGPNNGGKDMSKGNNKKGLGLQFSQSFYDNIGNAVKGQPTGNLADVKSKGAKEQAQNLRNAAATNQMEAQRAQQIANQKLVKWLLYRMMPRTDRMYRRLVYLELVQHLLVKQMHLMFSHRYSVRISNRVLLINVVKKNRQISRKLQN